MTYEMGERGKGGWEKGDEMVRWRMVNEPLEEPNRRNYDMI